MKKKTFLQGLLAAIIGNAFLFSCSSEEMNEGYYDVEKDNSTSMIANSKEQNIVFDIKYEVPEGNKVIFDVYANNPFEITSEGFTKKKDLKPIISAMTDEDGAYNIERVISDGVKEVYVVSNTMGVPALLHGVIERGVVKPMELDLSSLVDQEESVDSRALLDVSYLGSWNFWGRPNYVDKTKSCDISKRELQAISAALPEWVSVNSDYTAYDFIEVDEDAEVWISLLSEKSLFNNALGYYCYTEGMAKDDISEIIAFPRTNLSWLGVSGLKCGEYVKLKYLNPKTKQFEEKFPKGTKIGWVLHRSGFHCLTSKVSQGTYQFYSNADWNSEVNIKDHIALFKTSNDNVILSFEDTYNEILISDNDCNDLTFHVMSSPANAINITCEIPEVPEEDFVEEEVDVVQPLSSIVDIAEDNDLAQDLWVASKSVLNIEDGNVVGVKDVLYIANASTMDNMVTQSYSADEKERKVVVRTTVKFARAAEAEKKGRTVVRTTVKNTTWDVDSPARSIFAEFGNVENLILSVIEQYSEQLSAGEIITVEIVMDFEGVPYQNFVESISVPPYTPFIENAGE